MEKNRHILSRLHGLSFPGWLLVLALAVPGWQSCLSAAGAQPPEAELSLDYVLSKVKASERELKTFSASFKQRQKNHLLLEPLVSQGSMFYHHSGKLLIKISHPEPFVMLLSDRLMIMGDPLAKTFKQKTFSGRTAFLKRYLGMGQSVEGLKEHYDIRFENDCADRGCRLELVPKKRSRKMPFQSIRITIDTNLWLPTGIRLEEPNSDYTEFEWSYLALNDPLPEDLFIIDMPPTEMDDPFESQR